jgi:MoxR-like ATPase
MTTTMTSNEVQSIAREAQEQSRVVQTLLGAVEQVIVGQRKMIERLVIGLLCNGHVLLEGVPGLAKTLTVSTLARAIDAKFARVQFTPDLLPADLVGTLIYNPREGVFTPRKGPIFANIVLADEINRAPAKVQSALLEAMQERQVTIGDETYPLPAPFLVLATQNPIEQEGTYPLPEAQVDRFMLKLKVSYPSKAEERKVLDRMATSAKGPEVTSVVTLADILRARQVVDRIYVDEKVRDYIVDIVHASRNPAEYRVDAQGLIEFGASPRATIALTLCARAQAFLEGRGYVTPQDVKNVALDVLRHRIIASYEAEAEGLTSDDLVMRILDRIAVP